MEKLASLFTGFEQSNALPLFVLMGSFISQPLGRSAGGRSKVRVLSYRALLFSSLMDGWRQIIAAFDALADTISGYPRLAENAKFLLIPGPCTSRLVAGPA